jgi:hypothetical protein
LQPAKREERGVVIRAAFYRKGIETLPVLKGSRRCSLIILLIVGWREGRMLGNVGGKALRSGLCYERKKEVDNVFYSV